MLFVGALTYFVKVSNINPISPNVLLSAWGRCCLHSSLRHKHDMTIMCTVSGENYPLCCVVCYCSIFVNYYLLILRRENEVKLQTTNISRQRMSNINYTIHTLGKISIWYTADFSSFPTYNKWRDLSWKTESKKKSRKSHCMIFK